MRNGTARPGIDHRRTAGLVAEAVLEHEYVIYGIDGLRALGETGAAALEVMLHLPTVRRLQLSWQLFEALADGEGVDPEGYLVEALGLDFATYARDVLFPVERPSLSVVG